MVEAVIDLAFGQGDLPLVMEDPEQDDVASLVRRAQEGDREAFGELHSRYVRLVHGILLARVPHQEVEDLIQDVFLAALDRLGNLRDRDSFGAWIATIARNRAHDFHRRSRETEQLTDEMGATNHDDAEAQRVLSLIRTLPDAYRETLILRFVEGMTGPEIAARTGLTPGSVRVNLHRGVTLLREKLGVKND